MLFNSYIYILLFLPAVLLLYFVSNRISFKTGKLIMIVASLVFMAYMNIRFCAVFIVSMLFNYMMNMIISNAENRIKKYWFLIAITSNVVYLCVFKYSSFLIQALNDISHLQFSAISILLPLGISFYTFQQISILVDNYRGEIKGFNFLDYCLLTSFFPKFVQGPIVYYSEIVPQFNDPAKKKFNDINFAQGVYLFSIGLAKKVLIADKFALIVDYGYSHVSGLNSLEAVLTILGYSFQLYFDFSGYCDMAAGSAKMLNIDLPDNFDSPYKALNINDFWKRWHITLTRFLTKYVYIPLGGNRKSNIRTAVNIMAVFLISGIWHGAGYNYILWGALHGVARIIYQQIRSVYGKIQKFWQWLITFVFISVTWMVFRCTKISEVFSLIGRVINGSKDLKINAELTESLLQPVLINAPSQFLPLPVVLIVAVIIIMIYTVRTDNSSEMAEKFKPSFKKLLVTYVLLIISLLSISGVSSFLYVNF